MLELVAGKQVERADFSSADNRSVRPPSLSEVGRSHRGNLRRLAFSGFHGLPPKISDGQPFRFGIRSQFGVVQIAQVISDRETVRSKGFGFVEMDTDAQAQAAIQGLHDQDHDRRRLTVDEAKPRAARLPVSLVVALTAVVAMAVVMVMEVTVVVRIETLSGRQS